MIDFLLGLPYSNGMTLKQKVESISVLCAGVVFVMFLHDVLVVVSALQ